VRRSSRCNKTT